ncbi:MAG: ATP-binding cassette domain-containing protein [Lysobacteraceae bacterium]
MPVITLQNVDYAVGGPALLDKAQLAIEPGERLCVVGRNGAGKSTLLRLLIGRIQPDDGQIVRQGGLRVAMLEQAVPDGEDVSVLDCVLAGSGDIGMLLRRHHSLTQAPDPDHDELARVHDAIDAAHGWDLERRAEEVIARLDLPGEARFDALSGGLKRRVLLARALVSKPDLLLLDEPTNHLDIESIRWLEEFLRGFDGAIVFVTHDRAFLQAVATGIVEIDRGQLSVWPDDWQNYLRRREERLHAEAEENARFDKRLVAEEVWIRQGIKARRTRNEGRVRALKALRRERAERRELQGNVRIEQQATSRSGKRVIVAENLSFKHPGSDALLIDDFSTVIERGDRIGLIGPNGSGKTTLLRLLLGELKPDRGNVEHGTRLEIAYFDQHRSQLRDGWNAVDNVAEGREFIELNGRRVHALGYLQDFLFTPDRARAPITELSGGERNRLLLAKLFSKPSNLLVMDEPTNDLDMETLELLEEQLADYAGTVLLVSHDRAFLDAVVTSSIVMLGDGRVGEFVGGYSDWAALAGPAPTVTSSATTSDKPAAAKPTANEPAIEPKKRKLSYKDQRELDALPGQIEAAEARMAELSSRMSDPAFYSQDAEKAADAGRELAQLQESLDALYARWEALDA